MFDEIQNLDLSGLTQFYNEKIKPVDFNVAIIGKRENLDKNAVEKMGSFEELTLEEVFGY